MTLYRQLCYSESYHIWTLDCSLVCYQCANISLSSNNEPLIYKQWANARTMSHLTSHSEPPHLPQWATSPPTVSHYCTSPTMSYHISYNEPLILQTMSHSLNSEPPHLQQWATALTMSHHISNSEPPHEQWATTFPTMSHWIYKQRAIA